jgi:hypothetical protein
MKAGKVGTRQLWRFFPRVPPVRVTLPRSILGEWERNSYTLGRGIEAKMLFNYLLLCMCPLACLALSIWLLT